MAEGGERQIWVKQQGLMVNPIIGEKNEFPVASSLEWRRGNDILWNWTTNLPPKKGKRKAIANKGKKRGARRLSLWTLSGEG